MKKSIIMMGLMLMSAGIFAQQKTDKVQLVVKKNERKVDVLVDGQPFTSYFYPSDSILKKPVLFPIRTAQGTMITRGYPFIKSRRTCGSPTPCRYVAQLRICEWV
jgi:hypothetical protein